MCNKLELLLNLELSRLEPLSQHDSWEQQQQYNECELKLVWINPETKRSVDQDQ